MESRGREHGWKAAAARALGVSPSYIGLVEKGEGFKVGKRAMRDALRLTMLPHDYFERDEPLPPDELSYALGAGEVMQGVASEAAWSSEVSPKASFEERKKEWDRVTKACDALLRDHDVSKYGQAEELADAVLSLRIVRAAQQLKSAKSGGLNDFERLGVAVLLALEVRPVAAGAHKAIAQSMIDQARGNRQE